jgi:uncharacterized damage-inducible protein DinB
VLISQLMSAELANETAMTRKLLARIPQGKLEWKPADGFHTIGWNAAHLTEMVGWVSGILKEGEFDMSPVGGVAYVTPEATDTAQLLKTFDGNQANALAALQGVADSVMDEPWSLKMGGQVLFTMKKGDCLRKWVFSHSAHHRGILSVYLRMAGEQFPSIYEE